MGRLRALLGLSAAVTLVACATAEKQKPVAQAPAAALAPKPAPPAPAQPPTAAAPTHPAQTRAEPPHPAPPAPADPVSQLIDEAEKLYAAGLEDYRAGDLDKAAAKFNEAVSLLLTSKFDVDGNERLSAEFEKLVENVHGLEVAAVQRGETPGPHKYEPAPIESFQGLTFPVNPKVKEHIQEQIQSVHSDLPLVSNDYVDGVIAFFQSSARGQGFIRKILKRVGVYQPMIAEALGKEGVPQDLIYLAAGESGFNPFARSRKGAEGIWQFMLGTGVLYGLRKDRWVDEREDPVKSTHAAARHLKDLYQTFGDWFLAMAAYDSGPLTVQRAIEKTGYADFWTLRRLHALPTETENYVPIFLATAIIAKDPKAYGFGDVLPDAPPTLDRVTVSVPTDLRLVAELIDHPVNELIQLNPEMLRWTTPANNPEFVLNLPAGTSAIFQRAVAAIPEDKRIWWRTHKVGDGETLSSVAGKYRISTVALAEANQVDRHEPLAEGSLLVVPLRPGSESSLERVHERVSRKPIYYRVRPGDTLDLIADRFDVSPYQIRRWNGLRTSALAPGKYLRLYGRGSSGSRTNSATRSAHKGASNSSSAPKK